MRTSPPTARGALPSIPAANPRCQLRPPIASRSQGPRARAQLKLWGPAPRVRLFGQSTPLPGAAAAFKPAPAEPWCAPRRCRSCGTPRSPSTAVRGLSRVPLCCQTRMDCRWRGRLRCGAPTTCRPATAAAVAAPPKTFTARSVACSGLPPQWSPGDWRCRQGGQGLGGELVQQWTTLRVHVDWGNATAARSIPGACRCSLRNFLIHLNTSACWTNRWSAAKTGTPACATCPAWLPTTAPSTACASPPRVGRWWWWWVGCVRVWVGGGGGGVWWVCVGGVVMCGNGQLSEPGSPRWWRRATQGTQQRC